MDFGETTKEEGGEGLRLVNEMNEDWIWFGFCLFGEEEGSQNSKTQTNRKRRAQTFMCVFLINK